MDGLYATLLSRTPVPAEVASHVAALRRGLRPEALVAASAATPEFHARPPRLGEPLVRSVSQYGEVGLLLKHWASSAVAASFVVDVGAHGRARSNSWDLITHFGSRGLLIEANPALLPSIRAEFEGLDLSLLGLAISDYDGRSKLTIGIDDVSSLDPGAASAEVLPRYRALTEAMI